MPSKIDLKTSEDLIAKALNIGVTVDQIMAEINVYDWQDMKGSNPDAVAEDLARRLKFDNPKDQHHELRAKAFLHKLERAILNLSALIEEVNRSYNIPTPKGLSNEQIDQYYYFKYWADKKRIAVDYNETRLKKRRRFNLYTILFDIFADKLSNFNAYNRQKENK